MRQKRKILLVSINAFLVMIGFYFGLPSARSTISADKHSSEEIRRRVDSTTDVEKLRAIIVADDDYVRSTRDFALLFRQAAMAGSSVAVLVGLLNILLFILPESKHRGAA